MKKMFAKLLSVNSIVLILCYLMIVGGTSLVLKTYLTEQKESLLVEQAESIQEIFDSISDGNRYEKEQLMRELDIIKDLIGADIWLIDKNYMVYVADEEQKVIFEESELSKQEIDMVFDGKIVSKTVHFSAIYEEEVLIVGHPIYFNDEVVFAVFMNVPMPEISKSSIGITKITFSAFLIAFLIEVLMLLYYMRVIDKDIENLNKAVEYISNGNYEKKIKVTRNDELGDLAHKFNDMADELQESEIMKKKFIANLSHDLRSPLTSITGYTKGILEGTIPKDKQDRYLKIVLNESERLTKMTNDILDLSKMETGKLSINKTDFDINQQLLQVLDKFENRIVKKGLSLDITMHEEKLLAHGDVDAISRVIYNLLDNAIKFVDTGGKLGVFTEYKNDKFMIGIQNSGTVIPEDKLNGIWDRFLKLDDSRGLEKNSSGLGLAIVKEIIKAHDENIDVFSNEEVGVLFIFTLSPQIFKY